MKFPVQYGLSSSTPKIKYILFCTVRVVCVHSYYDHFDSIHSLYILNTLTLVHSFLLIQFVSNSFIYNICHALHLFRLKLTPSNNVEMFWDICTRHHHLLLLECTDAFYSAMSLIKAHKYSSQYIYIYIFMVTQRIQNREPGMHFMNYTHVIVLKTISLLGTFLWTDKNAI